MRTDGLLLVLAISASAVIGSGSPASPAGSAGALGLSLRSSSVTIEQSGSATVEIDFTRTSYSKPVVVKLVGFDTAGVSADVLVIDPSNNSGTLTLHASAAAASGTITGTVQGNGGYGSASIAVTVVPPAANSPLVLTVTPRAVTIPRSGQTTIQVDLTRNNYPDPVTVAIEGLAQAGINSSEVEIAAAGSTALIALFASPTAPLGTTQGAVKANGGVATTAITATVVASGSFSLDVNPLVTLEPGGVASALVTVTRLGGFAGAIDVAVAGLPAGVTVDPFTMTAAFSLGVLTFHSDGSGSAISGVPVTVTGTSGTAAASTALALTLRGLSIFVLSRALFIGQGQVAGIAVKTISLTSVTGPKTITVAGLPQGVLAAQLQILDGETIGALQLTAAADAAPGAFPLTVTATSGSTTASAALTLTVETNSVRIGSVDPGSITMAAGTSRRVAVEIIRTGSFRTLALPVSVSGLPAGVTADPLFLDAQSSSGAVILHAAADTVLGGPAAVSIDAGTFGTDPCSFDCDVLASAPLALTIAAPFDFDLVGASVSLPQGATASPVVRLTRNAGFGGSVSVHVGGLAAGVAARDVTLAPGTTSAEIDLTATATAAAGSSVLDVTASGAGYTVRHALPLQVFVPGADSPSIASFVPGAGQVFVGERARLTAVFTGDGASIDGIGPVQSGQPIDTPVLARATTFTLRVRRGTEQVETHATVEVRYRNRLRQLAAAPVGRGIHLAATLPGGGALLMGGHTSDALHIPSTNSTQRFDPAAETTLNGPDLPFFVNTPETSVVQLVDGGFLLIGGGINSNSFGLGADADRATLAFGPTDQQFVQVGNTQEHRRGFTLGTALLDGGALLTGGSQGLFLFASAERFDPTTRHWSNTGSMSVGRVGHTGTRLPDGRVLIAGGLTCCEFTPGLTRQVSTDTAEIYDPDTDQFTQTGSLAAARSFHTATLLPDGRVLIAGGVFGDDANPAPVGAEVYDPSTGEFSPAGALQVARGTHTAVLLNDGRVLVVGGVDAAQPFVGIQATEIYDPATNNWSLGPVLQPAWIESTVTLLGNGKVLIFGGETPQTDPVSTVMLFE